MHTQPNLRRHAMAGTCLLALPTALALAPPAAAQSQITQSQTTPLTLSSYGGGAVNITSGVSITANGWAAVSDNVAAHLANQGQIADATGNGVYLAAGGVLTNGGAISGADAVRLNAAGNVANSGNVQAANYGVLVNNGSGQVSNTGAISAGYDGVSLNQGGAVTNSGSIFGGHMGVYTGNGAGNVSNSGIISAHNGDAVSLYSGGSLNNSATGQILGGDAGAYAGGSGSHITNAGLISGPQIGIYLTGASSISNGGTIAGGVDGVKDLYAGGQLTNTGLIHGGQVGVKLAANGAVADAGMISGGTMGVQLGRNGTLVVETGGHVTGGQTGVVAAAGDVLRNSGTIGGLTGIIANGAITLTDTGLISGSGGTAISLGGGASTLTFGTGASVNGAILGGGTASQISLTGNGVLNASISGFAAGSAVSVAPGANWVGEGHWQVAQLSNAGVFTPGEMGAPLTLTGNFIQTSTGTLRVLVTPQGISPFAIIGTAQLGGTLSYVLAPGTYSPATDNFLTATGGISGSFASVSSSQSASQVPLVAVGGAIAVPRAFTISPAGSPLFAETSQAMMLDADAGGQALLAHANGASAPCAALPQTGRSTAAGLAQALAGGFCAAGGWLEATGSTLSAPGDFSADGGGFLAGVDRADTLGGRLGLAVGYDQLNMKDKTGNSAGMQAVRLGLYASQPLGAFTFSAAFMDGLISSNTTRITGAGGAVAKGNANVISAMAQIALPLSFGGADVTPAFGLRISSLSLGRLNETAANQAFALNAAPASGTRISPYLRLSIARRFVTAGALVITPDVSLGVAVASGNPGANIQLVAADDTKFTSSAAHFASVSGQFGAGLSVGRGAWALTLRYNTDIAGNFVTQSLQAGVQLRF